MSSKFLFILLVIVIAAGSAMYVLSRDVQPNLQEVHEPLSLPTPAPTQTTTP